MLTVMAFFWIIRKLWYLIVLIIQLVGVIDIITSKISRNTKIGWVIVVIIFPILGTILYFLLGGRDKSSD